jgi:serine/threonine-protein kinase
MGACLSEATILALLERRLDPGTARAAEGHLARCDECRTLVSSLARSSLVARPGEPALAPTEPMSGPGSGGEAKRGRDSTPPIRPGDLIAEKFQVDRVIGSGGMGVVVQATHVALGQRVAIKFLLTEACEAPGAVARFLREARAAVQIEGEHVARVLDVGTLSSGAPYMVMEYLRGADLADVLLRGGPLAQEVAVDYVLQACEAIAEAHALGIVHRDLKPANLFLASRPDGSPLVKVLDFGISKQQRGPSGLTSGEVMMGSPRYMSPEQMRSTRDVDARTDVWALGTILFELVSGKPVFDSDSMAGLCAAIQTQPAPALRSVRPGVSELLDRVVARCLEKDPRAPIATVAELAQALAPIAPARAQIHVERIVRLLGGPRPAVVPASAPHHSAPPIGAATAGSFGGTSPGTRALPLRLFSMLVALLALGIVGGVMAVRFRSPRPEPVDVAEPSAARDLPTAMPSAAPAMPSAIASAPASAITSSSASAPPSAPATARAPRRPTKPAVVPPRGPEPPSDVNRRGLTDRK